MKLRKILLTGSVLVLCSLFAAPAFSQSQDSGKVTRPFMRNRTFAKLNLTADQKAKIQDFGFKHQSTMIDLRADLAKARLDLKEIHAKDNISRDEVLAAVGKINKVRDQIAIERANHLMDIYSVLTPAQRKIAKERLNRRHMMMRGNRFEHRGMMGRGFNGGGRFFMNHRGPGNFNGSGGPMGFLSPDNQQIQGNQDNLYGMAFAPPNAPQEQPSFDAPNELNDLDAVISNDADEF